MPRLLRRLGVALLLLWLFCCGKSARAQSEYDYWEPARASDFHDALLPYGEWLDIQAYGRVWRPSPDVVGDDFVPYLTGGQWLYSEYGWFFSSIWDDQFGWAVFHYGRWIEDRQYGWLWFPDVRWAASWVEWNTDDSWVGWYPTAPSGVQVMEVSWIVVPAGSFAALDVARFVPKTRPKLVGRAVPPPQGTATATLVVRGRPPLIVGPQPAARQLQSSWTGAESCPDCVGPVMGGGPPPWWVTGGGSWRMGGRPPLRAERHPEWSVASPSWHPGAGGPPPLSHPTAAPMVHGGGGSAPSHGASPSVHTAAPVMRATPPSSGGGHSFRATPPSSGGGHSFRATPPRR